MLNSGFLVIIEKLANACLQKDNIFAFSQLLVELV